MGRQAERPDHRAGDRVRASDVGQHPLYDEGTVVVLLPLLRAEGENGRLPPAHLQHRGEAAEDGLAARLVVKVVHQPVGGVHGLGG